MQKILARQSPGTDAQRKPVGDDVRRSKRSRDILETIFRLEYSGLVRFISRKVGPDAACDIAQEVFLRAAGSPQLDGLCSPRGFLYKIARNAIIDRSRRERCRIVTLPITETIEAATAAEQEHQLEADDLADLLDHALSGLSEKTRQVFIMSRVDEMAYRDIHMALGISVATVEYHMMKALSHIRASLHERL